MTDAIATPSLHRKLTEVMAAIDWQPKTGRNQAQGYNFVSVERIKDTVRVELSKQRVMVYTSIKALERSESQTKSGSTMYHVTVQGEVTFADGDSGEMFTVEAAGEAMDTGDKALNKAQTALVKYALINTFLIPTGDDPDADTPETAHRPTQRPQTPAKPAALPSAPVAKPAVTEGQHQCESRSPYSHEDSEGEERPQCRLILGHTGAHKTRTESWT